MRVRVLCGFCLCFLAAIALAMTTARPASAAGKAHTVADLAWIGGSWEMDAGDSRTEEHWTPAADNALLGMSRVLAGGNMVFFEYLRIEARADGIYYVAQPEGRPGTDFRLSEFDGTTAVFENPEHDFPKRILYRRNADGSMTARIDGGAGIEKGMQEFPYRPLNR